MPTMDKTNPPTSFGVFKPVGHTLIAFHTEDELVSAVVALKAMDFVDDNMAHYSAEQMSTQIAVELRTASPLATFGYELDLIHMHEDMAKKGCSFLVVNAPTDARAAQVAELVRSIKPVTAQHYGRFMIEDLTETAPGRVDEKETAV
jgi:hypothetical protein